MTGTRLSIVTMAVCGLGAGFLAAYAQEARPHGPVATPRLSTVSGITPFSLGCNGQQTGIDYLNSAVEPSVAVDPLNPKHLIGVWQQDRWSNGGANGVVTGVSTDRGKLWTTTFAHFSKCSGGPFELATDPWVTISPDGTAYQIALGVNISTGATGVLVSRSSDGGFTWSDPITLVADGGDDKTTITADPIDPHFVYAVWDRTNGANLADWFSRTTDGGASWEPARVVYDAGVNAAACCQQIAVLPDGTLVDVFVQSQTNSQTSLVAVIRSTDRGITWSTPTFVSGDLSIGVVDARTQAGIRTGNGIPSTAVDPVSGAIYITWEDARFSGGQREGVALAKSIDGGISWSNPVQVNQVPNVQAFNPTVAVGATRTLLTPGAAVAITYYDFRQATSNVTALLTNYWQIVSLDGGTTWRETPVAGPFDILRAPISGSAYFLGDYQALVAAGNIFIPFFVTTDSGDSAIPSAVFASPVEGTGSLASNGHVETDLYPHSFIKRYERKLRRP